MLYSYNAKSKVVAKNIFLTTMDVVAKNSKVWVTSKVSKNRFLTTVNVAKNTKVFATIFPCYNKDLRICNDKSFVTAKVVAKNMSFATTKVVTKTFSYGCTRKN